MKAETNISHVVLIDDDVICNVVSKAIITKHVDVKISEFTDPVKALVYCQYLAKHSPAEFPDVIFLDINMPEMDGWEFLEEFEKLPEAVINKSGVVMLTSSIAYDDVIKSKTFRSVYDFLSKPLTHDKLVKAMTLVESNL